MKLKKTIWYELIMRFLLEKYVCQKRDTELTPEKEISQQAFSIYKKSLLERLKG